MHSSFIEGALFAGVVGNHYMLFCEDFLNVTVREIDKVIVSYDFENRIFGIL